MTGSPHVSIYADGGVSRLVTTSTLTTVEHVNSWWIHRLQLHEIGAPDYGMLLPTNPYDFLLNFYHKQFPDPNNLHPPKQKQNSLLSIKFKLLDKLNCWNWTPEKSSAITTAEMVMANHPQVTEKLADIGKNTVSYTHLTLPTKRIV